MMSIKKTLTEIEQVLMLTLATSSSLELWDPHKMLPFQWQLSLQLLLRSSK